MKPTTRTVTAVLIFATSGCMGSPHGDGAASEADVTRYQELSTQLTSATADYHSAMMAQSDMDPADCQQLHQKYHGQAWPWVFEMHERAGAMDRAMHGHGGIGADYACVTQGMQQEFQHHHAIACTFGDVSANQAETERHVAAMTAYTGHLQSRCDELMMALDGSAPEWAPMLESCQDWYASQCRASHNGMMQGPMMVEDPACN